MIQYLIILLDDTSVSYCHYDNPKTERRLIALDDLNAGIIFAMKQNRMIQFVYPDYELPKEYEKVIETIDNNKIMPISGATDKADVIVFDRSTGFPESVDSLKKNAVYVWRTSKNDLFAEYEKQVNLLKHIKRLNIISTDIDTFDEDDFKAYRKVLNHLQLFMQQQYASGLDAQLNLLSDRILLNAMNNCNAGVESITLAPNGHFYICPAFYLEDENDASGSPAIGLDIKNKSLYRLNHAPLCRICDAYQCKRCVWLNRKTTLEINTPSHEQCVTAHLERNASRNLLLASQAAGNYFPEREIKEISYLDPFDVREKW